MTLKKPIKKKRSQDSTDILKNACSQSSELEKKLPPQDVINSALGNTNYGIVGNTDKDDEPKKALENTTNILSDTKQLKSDINTGKALLLDPDTIADDFKGNSRKLETAKIDELAESIKKAGKNVQPIVIRLHPDPNSKFKYQVIAGRRRRAACKSIDFNVFAVVVEATDREAIIIATYENTQSLLFSIYELSEQIAMLHEVTGITFDEVVTLYNAASEGLRKPIKRSAAYDLLSLRETPLCIQEVINDSHNMTINQGVNILKQCREQGEGKLIALIDTLSEKITAKEMLKLLNDSAPKKCDENKDHPLAVYMGETVSTNDGKKAFKISGKNPNSPSLRFDKSFSPEKIIKIIEFAKTI